MNMKTNFLLKASLGFSISVLIRMMIFVICFIALPDAGMDVWVDMDFAARIGNAQLSFCIEILCYGAIGVTGMGGVALTYDNDRLSILTATIMHFIPTVVVFTAVGVLFGWIEPAVTPVNIVIYALWIVAYAMIWIISDAVYKSRIKKINMQIAQIKKGV